VLAADPVVQDAGCPSFEERRDLVSVARPSRPLVAMISVAAGSRIAALKIRNLAVFDAGTTS
jgi:hypothetical protein